VDKLSMTGEVLFSYIKSSGKNTCMCRYNLFPDKKNWEELDIM